MSTNISTYDMVGHAMKTIDTLVADIYEVLDKGKEHFKFEDREDYGWEQSELLKQRLDRDAVRGEGRGGLRLSSIGSPCARKLWYGLHAPDEREPLEPNTRLKFLYGDTIETLVLQLAIEAGHLVQGEQDEVSCNGVVGHRDCVIDGMLVDVKSASPYSFVKFKGGLQRDDDSFGYLTQLGSYLLASQDDDLVKEKNKAAFLVMDKVSGKLHLDVHTFTEEDFDEINGTIIERKDILSKEGDTPNRAFNPIPEGKSGNLKLGVNCSYCDFKRTCHEGLRTFIYSGNRPMFLTHVEKTPKVYEVLER